MSAATRVLVLIAAVVLLGALVSGMSSWNGFGMHVSGHHGHDHEEGEECNYEDATESGSCGSMGFCGGMSETFDAGGCGSETPSELNKDDTPMDEESEASCH